AVIHEILQWRAHASLLGEGCAVLARRRTGWADSLPPNSRRAAPPICPDLIVDRHSHSSGLLVILSTVLAISNSNYAGQAKATCSGSAALMYFNPGASGDRSSARPRTSPGRGARPIGNACRQGPEPKDRGCTIGAISNWPISRPENFTAQIMVFGHEVC